MKTIASSAALLAASLVLVSCAATPGNSTAANDSTTASTPSTPPPPSEPPRSDALPALEPNPVGSTIWKELPVYEVLQNGASPAQNEALYAALGLGQHMLASADPVVDYTDTDRYLDVPTRKVSEDRALRTPGENDEDIQASAIDGDAIQKITVYDGAEALKAAAAAADKAQLPLEGAQATVGHTVFQATYTDANGAPVSLDQPIDTFVTYHFATADGIPFIGPGAVFSITYDSKGNATQVHYAWRAVKPGTPVKVITEAEARKRIAKTLPKNAKVTLRLIYWCPPFGSTLEGGKPLEPISILPFYAYRAEIPAPATPGAVPSSPRQTRERLIPATDDNRFVPMVNRLDVTGSGTARVSASMGANGGRPPYTYLWTGSNPEVLTDHSYEASYVPLVRSAPPPAAAASADQTVDAMETISVTAIDANGISAMETVTFPVQARPIRAEEHKHGHAHPTFGCESPGEPEDWVQERVGWQAGMSNPGAGTQAFCWLGDNSWPGDYIKPTPAGSLPAKPWIYGDADYANWGVNTANLVLINGDGWPEGFTAMFPGAPESDYNNNVGLNRPGYPGGTVQMPSQTYSVNYDGSWGTEGPNDRLYWLAGLLCECLKPTDSGGLDTHQRWGAAFGGVHIFTGFANNAAYSAGAFPKAFAERILGVSGKAQTIKAAWFNASTATAEGNAAAMGPIAKGGVSDLDDYYVGQGSMGPSIAPSKITGWWYLHQ